MGLQIEGSGRFPYGMEVDSYGRAQVKAVVVTELTTESEVGDSYCISSEEVALTTTASYSGILQIKNTSTRKMYLSIFCLGGSESGWWKVIRNPDDTGTLWASGTVISADNLNFSSGNVFPAVNGAKKGADASTVGGGTTMNAFYVPTGEFTKVLDGAIQLGPANSIAFMCKPAAACSVHASMLVYFEGT